MKIGLVQLDQEWENLENNIVKINELVESAVSDEDALIFLEMTLTGVTMNRKKFGEENNGTGTKLYIHLSSTRKKHIF